MSILQKLEDESVVSFTDFVESFICIEECCDNHFYVSLNKKEFGQMIEELRELHSKMVD